MPFDSLICRNPLKKKHILWFLIDGLAFDQIQMLFKEYKEKANFFTQKTNFFRFFKFYFKMKLILIIIRQSGALHDI